MDLTHFFFVAPMHPEHPMGHPSDDRFSTGVSGPGFIDGWVPDLVFTWNVIQIIVRIINKISDTFANHNKPFLKVFYANVNKFNYLLFDN